MDGDAGAAIFIFVFLAMLITGGFIGHMVTNTGYHRDLIQRGLAEYCATTGAWAFKGECE